MTAETTPTSDTRRVIEAFLSHADELHQPRIQKLMFYGDVYTLCHYGYRLTEVAYEPYMYGTYSTDIGDTLDTMDGHGRSRRVRYGNRTHVYRYTGGDEDLHETRRRIVAHVFDYTENMSTEVLAQFSKDTWLFHNTPANKEMDFAKYRAVLDKNPGMEKKLLLQLPERLDGISTVYLKSKQK